MEILNNLKSQKQENLSVILGFFDGIHKGHKTVINTAVRYAENNDLKSALVTFKNAPVAVLKNLKPQYILTETEKIKKIENLGIDYLYVLDFDEKLQNTTAADYLKLLIENLHPKAITTGENHYFGFNKTGNSDYLELMQEDYGYEYFKVNSIKYEDNVVSSSKIKEYLQQGKINDANLMLGYRFYVFGEVVKGRQIGRTIGFKTANLDYPDSLVNLPDGVYAVEVEVKDKKYIGIANYGSNPTVTDDTKKLLEVHILNFDEDIYGEFIKVNFLDKIRDEKKFQSLTELKEQITKDIECLES
ncbi:bifunctional riboflavin kinase/FAD synthetase [bacterium]|nr:bifunctional riboflavin kinase/FAD synthetase [bacterium]